MNTFFFSFLIYAIYDEKAIHEKKKMLFSEVYSFKKLLCPFVAQKKKTEKVGIQYNHM